MKSLSLVLLSFFIYSTILESQILIASQYQNNFCECCSYHSLQYKQNEYETIFPPEIIKKNGYKELIVNVSGKERIDTSKTNQIKVRKLQIKEYREIKFLFNNQGYVTSVYWYNRMGKPHSIHKFERNNFGKVIKDTFSYLDSLENPTADWGTEIQILTYDKNNNLLKVKKMGNKGKELPDDKSQYDQNIYDAKGKIIKTITHYYFEGLGGESINTTNIKYNESNLTSESISTYNGGTSQTTKTTYNTQWKPIEEKTYDNKTKKLILTTTYKYDSNNNLISYYPNQTERSSSECPETKGFLDLYTINSFGVIETITHNFDNHTCEMTFEYKK